jgi:hypothetical protein
MSDLPKLENLRIKNDLFQSVKCFISGEIKPSVSLDFFVLIFCKNSLKILRSNCDNCNNFIGGQPIKVFQQVLSGSQCYFDV